MKKFFTTLLTIFLSFNSDTFCAFIEQNFSVRANGLAGSCVGLADDVGCISYNPAGLRQVLVKSISLSYFKPYLGIPDLDFNSVNFTYSHPFQNIGVFGISYNYFDILTVYKENILSLTYSNKLNDFIESLTTEVYSGITLKILGHTYDWDEETKQIAQHLSDPVITKGSSAAAFTLDIGSIIRLGKIVYLGISLINLLPANVGIYYEDIVPVVSRIGISFRKNLDSSVIKKLNLNYDISYRGQEWGEFKDKFNLHSSAEVYIYDKFVLRTGVNFDYFSLGFSYFKELPKNLRLEFLYNFSLPFRITDNYGSHNVSIVYSFGKPIVDKKKEVIEEKIKVKEELLKEIFQEEEKEEKQEKQQPIEQPKQEQQQEIEQESLQPSTTEQQQIPIKIEEKKEIKGKKEKKEIKEDELEKDIIEKLLQLEEKQ